MIFDVAICQRAGAVNDVGVSLGFAMGTQAKKGQGFIQSHVHKCHWAALHKPGRWSVARGVFT